MKKAILALFAGLVLGAFVAAQAKLPPAPPKSDTEKAAEAEKAKAAAAKEAAETAKAQDKAVANYNRSHGSMATQAPKKK
jgi:gas vesicle protein